MSFRNVLVELKVGNTDWANITDDVLGRNPIQISRGKADEAGIASPSRCSLTLNNRLGRYSPRNPLSPLYGMIGRNTPLRVSLGMGAYGLVVTDSTGRAECNDSAALSFVGDLDLRVDLEVLEGNSWTSGSFDLASKFDNVAGSLCWSLILIGGKLRFHWFTSGTSATVKQAESIVLPGPATGRRAVRVTLDVNNGAVGNTTTFYTAPDISGTWTTLGSAVIQAGVTNLFDTPSKLRIGSASGGSAYTFGSTDPATFYSAELRNSIGGTVVASPNFTTQPLDPVPFSLSGLVDTQGNFWGYVGTADAARIWYGDVDVRFHGEIAALPPRWDVSGNDAFVPLEAAGILRRLGQGTDPASTGLRDFIMGGASEPADLPPALASYWPLDGAEGTTYSLNLGRQGNKQARFRAEGAPIFSYGVDMGPFIGSGMELNSTGLGTSTGDPAMRADIGAGDDNAALDFVFQSPAFGVLTTVIEDYDGNKWTLTMNTPADAGTLQVKFTAGDIGLVFPYTASSVIPQLQDTSNHHCRLQVTTNAPDTDFEVYIDGVLVSSGSIAGYIWAGTATARFFYERYSPQTVMNMAHVTLWSYPTPGFVPTAADITDAMLGYTGETAAERMLRVAAAGGIALEIVGDPDETTVMGPQHSEGKLQQIRDAESTDLGILVEARDSLSLLYRSRASMYNQVPKFTLDFTAGQIAPPFEPTDDDQTTRNIITCVNRDGGSYRLEKSTGALSVQDPPLGVGPYRDEVTVNVETDEQLPEVAGWLLSLGTLDEARYPSIAVDLHNPAVVADTALAQGVLDADTGDRLAIVNVSELNVYDDISLLILGDVETLDTFTHTRVFNCTSASPFEVFTVEDTNSRISSGDATTLTSAINSTQTTMSLTSTAGTLWAANASGQLPVSVMVGGEEMTINNIADAPGTSPQTVTSVTRSVNGVVKTHSSGEIVRLKRRAVWAL